MTAHMPDALHWAIFAAFLVVLAVGWAVYEYVNAADGDALGLESSGDVRWRRFRAGIEECRADFDPDPTDVPLLEWIAANELRGFFASWDALAKEETS